MDRIAREVIERNGPRPAFLGYRNYPATLCASVNEQVVHGIPGKRKLVEGDIVGLDLGCVVDGFFGDAARTVAVGPIGDEAARLMKVTKESLFAGIDACHPGKRVGDIGHAVQTHAERHGYSVVREFVGHGIGRKRHEPPQVPNFGAPGTGVRLRPGMVLALEPMVNVGGPDVYTKSDRWTIVTADGSLSAHYEQTVAITENGPEVLTGPLHTGFDGGLFA